MLTEKEMEALVARLGKESDVALAKKYPISRQRIAALRTKRGIPVYRPEGRMAYPLPTHFTESDERNINKAMKKAGVKNRSKWIRDAVRAKNKEVLR
jgi:hypothetical protein